MATLAIVKTGTGWKKADAGQQEQLQKGVQASVLCRLSC